MIEVVDYLRDNGFTVYVFSGADWLTVRPLLEILRLRPFGSSVPTAPSYPITGRAMLWIMFS